MSNEWIVVTRGPGGNERVTQVRASSAEEIRSTFADEVERSSDLHSNGKKEFNSSKILLVVPVEELAHYQVKVQKRLVPVGERKHSADVLFDVKELVLP